MTSKDIWWRYARSHHVYGFLFGMALLTLCDVAFGSVQIVFPTTHVAIMFRRELPIVFASLAVGSLQSTMENMECAATGSLRRMQWLHVTATVLLAAALVGITELFISSSAIALLLVRAFVIWTGMAMLSGRIFGWSLAWLLPMSTIFPLTYLAQDATGRDSWWDWTIQSVTLWPCWIIAGASLIFGIAAMSLTPWHLSVMKNPLRITPSPHQTGGREDKPIPRSDTDNVG